MKKSKIIAIVIFSFIILLAIIYGIINNITKETTSSHHQELKDENLNKVENTESNLLNVMENSQEINLIEEKIENNVIMGNLEVKDTKQQSNTIEENTPNKTTTEPKVNIEQKITTTIKTTETTNKNTSNKKQETTVSQTKEEDKKENEVKNETQTEVGNPSLAYATYRIANASVLPEIKAILEDEISKDKVSVDFGTKVVYGSKSQCYNNTNGFTYMLIADPVRGKVEGNYTKFPQRVRNVVGALGTYYIYAEDEYTYNGQGLNPKLAQTLVWIYVSFN